MEPMGAPQGCTPLTSENISGSELNPFHFADPTLRRGHEVVLWSMRMSVFMPAEGRCPGPFLAEIAPNAQAWEGSGGLA